MILYTIKKEKHETDCAYRCPVCGNYVNTAIYVCCDTSGESCSHILRCPQCTFMFTRPVLLPVLDERQMDSLDDSEMYGSQIMKFFHRQMYLRKEINYINKIGLTGATVLDVGCGTGWITDIWAQNGFQVTGLEPSPSRSAFAREKYGIHIVSDYIEKVNFVNQFNVCILRHVIEHFEEPLPVLENVHQTLKNDGIVLVVVPNIDCIGRYLFDVDWEWVLPWHCNFFNRRSLETMLNKSGFDLIKIYQTASPFYLFQSLVRKLDSQFLSYINSNFRVASMLATSPVAMLGLLMGFGDSLTAIARVRK